MAEHGRDTERWMEIFDSWMEIFDTVAGEWTFFIAGGTFFGRELGLSQLGQWQWISGGKLREGWHWGVGYGAKFITLDLGQGSGVS